MQPDIDAQLTNFFEDAPPREFATVMRGYDRHQVDEHIRQLEVELRQLREQVQSLRRELSQAHGQEQERPTYSGLGARIEQLLRLAEEQATELVQAARSEANEIKAAAKVDAAELRAGAENEASELRANAKRETDDLRGAAEREADSIRTTARREADELTNTTEREVAKLRATADHEVADKRAAAERDIAKLRTSTEREVAQLKATAKRERDEILTTSKRQADEMRSQAQRILEESEAQRAQAEAEFEIQLAARREEAERQEAERLAAAQSATQKLVSEAEQRASTAEQRAAKASAQADQTRRDADSHARQLVSNAKKNADQIVSQAKSQAEQMLAETKADAERRRAAAQREVDELTRQKDSIATHLAQVRQLLGGQLPGMGANPAMQAPAPKPATVADQRISQLPAAFNDTDERSGPDRPRSKTPALDGIVGRVGESVLLVAAKPKSPQAIRPGESAAQLLPIGSSEMLDEISVEIYLATNDESAIARIVQHVDELVEALGYNGPLEASIERGSFIRHSWAKIKQSLTSEDVRELLLKTQRAAELRYVDNQQAEVDNKIADTLKKLIESLADVPSAFVQAGSVLVIKYPGPQGQVVKVRILSQLEIKALEQFPEVQREPQKALESLALIVSDYKEPQPQQGSL